ncbi:hypothetical protein EV127DRAFT_487909 [Xylaria flabelliformis]|nr:hypothetical protein EV127DRAFT_487909 [Xylaria flabelliformis]
MFAKLCVPAAMAFAILTVSASPLGTDLQDAPPADNGTFGQQSLFHWRFYDNYGCNHLSSPSDTWPDITTPAPEGEAGVCYSAPEGVNWNRVEIMDISFPSAGSLGIQTFCHINCASSSTGKQQNTNCAVPVDGCAIGSL